MKGTEIRDLILDYTDQSTQSFPLAQMVRYFNVQKNMLCMELEQINEGYFTVEQYRDLVAGQREYQLPVGMMNRIEKVYIKFPVWPRYIIATEALLSMEPWAMDEATIQARYTDIYPRFLLRKNSIILLTQSAIPDSPEGLQLWAKMYPSDITTATLGASYDLSVPVGGTAVGIPSQLHELICRKVSIMYKTTRDFPLPLNESEQRFDIDFQRIKDVMKNQNLERDVVPYLPSFTDEGDMILGGSYFNPYTY